MKLYEIADEYRSLLLEAEFGEVNELTGGYEPSDPLLLEKLNQIAGFLDVKVENICKIIKNLQADAEAVKAEEERLRARRKSLEARVEFLRKYVVANTPVDYKIKTPFFTIYKMKTQAVTADDGFDVKSLVPLGLATEYVEYNLSKAAIKADLKDREFPFLEDANGKRVSLVNNSSLVIK